MPDLVAGVRQPRHTAEATLGGFRGVGVLDDAGRRRDLTRDLLDRGVQFPPAEATDETIDEVVCAADDALPAWAYAPGEAGEGVAAAIRCGIVARRRASRR